MTVAVRLTCPAGGARPGAVLGVAELFDERLAFVAEAVVRSGAGTLLGLPAGQRLGLRLRTPDGRHAWHTVSIPAAEADPAAGVLTVTLDVPAPEDRRPPRDGRPVPVVVPERSPRSPRDPEGPPEDVVASSCWQPAPSGWRRVTSREGAARVDLGWSGYLAAEALPTGSVLVLGEPEEPVMTAVPPDGALLIGRPGGAGRVVAALAPGTARTLLGFLSVGDLRSARAVTEVVLAEGTGGVPDRLAWIAAGYALARWSDPRAHGWARELARLLPGSADAALLVRMTDDGPADRDATSHLAGLGLPVVPDGLRELVLALRRAVQRERESERDHEREPGAERDPESAAPHSGARALLEAAEEQLAALRPGLLTVLGGRRPDRPEASDVPPPFSGPAEHWPVVLVPPVALDLASTAVAAADDGARWREWLRTRRTDRTDRVRVTPAGREDGGSVRLRWAGPLTALPAYPRLAPAAAAGADGDPVRPPGQRPLQPPQHWVSPDGLVRLTRSSPSGAKVELRAETSAPPEAGDLLVVLLGGEGEAREYLLLLTGGAGTARSALLEVPFSGELLTTRLVGGLHRSSELTVRHADAVARSVAYSVGPGQQAWAAVGMTFGLDHPVTRAVLRGRAGGGD